MTVELPDESTQTLREGQPVLAAAAPDPSGALENKEELRLLGDAIGALPPDLKQAFILAVLEGHSQKECAEMLGVSLKAVETRIYRARKFLAAKFRSPLS